jgi:hypothetical protein
MKRKVEQIKPQVRKEGLVVQRVQDEVLVYDRDRNKAHCLNETAAAVWKHCDGKTTVDEMAGLLEKQLGIPVEKNVLEFGLDQLEKAHLLEAPMSRASNAAAISRREVMRRIGIGAAVALPLVTSIIAPRAANAVNCRATGQACTTNAQCCSNNCVGGTTCA